MKKLGEVISKTNTGLIVASTSLRDPKRIVGAIVYDKDMRRIGRVIDVIGPVESPYVVIKPDSKDILGFIGENTLLYYYVERKPRRKTRSRRTRGKKGRKQYRR